MNACNIPPTAQAVAFNFTVAQAVGAGDIRVSPAGQPFPFVSTLNFGAGQTRANNAIVSLGPNGDIAVRSAAGPTHFVIDITGYLE